MPVESGPWIGLCSVFATVHRVRSTCHPAATVPMLGAITIAGWAVVVTSLAAVQ